MAGGFTKYAGLINLGSRAFSGIRGFFKGKKMERIKDAADEAHTKWRKSNPQATPAEIGANHSETLVNATAATHKSLLPKIGIIGGGTILAANVLENGLDETLEGASEVITSPFDSLERFGQKRLANIEAMQATIAGLEAQVAGQTPMLTFLSFIQSIFPTPFLQNLIDDRMSNISALREQMKAAEAGGYGNDPTANGGHALSNLVKSIGTPLEFVTPDFIDQGSKTGTGLVTGVGVGAGVTILVKKLLNNNNTPDSSGGGGDGSAGVKANASSTAPKAGTSKSFLSKISDGIKRSKFGKFLKFGVVATAAVVGGVGAANAEELSDRGVEASPSFQAAVTPVIQAGLEMVPGADVIQNIIEGDTEAAIENTGGLIGGLTAAFAAAAPAAAFGAAVGTAIPIPFVGTAVGFIAGGAAGLTAYVLGDTIGRGITSLFNDSANDDNNNNNNNNNNGGPSMRLNNGPLIVGLNHNS